MQLKKIAATLAAATLLGAAGSALAAGMGAEYYPFADIMSMKMIDKNKDSMVSKKEFMDMMDKTWEMKAKKMGAKGDTMTPAQFDEVLMYLKAGG